MTRDEWHLLAERFEKERLKGEHTPQNADMLSALASVALGMWANLPKPKET